MAFKKRFRKGGFKKSYRKGGFKKKRGKSLPKYYVSRGGIRL